MISDGIPSKLKNPALLWLFQYMLSHVSFNGGHHPSAQQLSPKWQEGVGVDMEKQKKTCPGPSSGEGAESGHRKAAQG